MGENHLLGTSFHSQNLLQMFFSKKKKLAGYEAIQALFPHYELGAQLEDSDFQAVLSQPLPKKLVASVLLLDDDYKVKELYAEELQDSHPAQWYPIAWFSPYPKVEILLYTYSSGAADEWAYSLEIQSFYKEGFVEQESFQYNFGSLYLRGQWTSIVKSTLQLDKTLSLKQQHWSIPLEENHADKAALPHLLERAAKEAEEIKEEAFELSKKGKVERL